jgi:hypothetical protein
MGKTPDESMAIDRYGCYKRLGKRIFSNISTLCGKKAPMHDFHHQVVIWQSTRLNKNFQ